VQLFDYFPPHLIRVNALPY